VNIWQRSYGQTWPGWLLSRLVTYYLCGSSEGLDDGLELEVIDQEEEMGNGEASKAEDDGSEVG
jgi:hypothetical protein